MIFPFFMAIHWNLWDILSPYVPIVMDINPLNPHRFWKKKYLYHISIVSYSVDIHVYTLYLYPLR